MRCTLYTSRPMWCISYRAPFAQIPLRASLLTAYPLEMFLLSGTIIISHLSFIRIDALCVSKLYTATTWDAATVPFAVTPMSVIAWAHARLMFVWFLNVQACVCRYRLRRMRRVQWGLNASRSDGLNTWTAVIRAFGHWNRLPSEK